MEQKTVQQTEKQGNRPTRRSRNRRDRKGEKSQTPVAKVEAAVTPTAPRQTKEERKDARYELAKEQTSERINYIKSNDLDGDMIVKTYGMSYELSKVVDSMMMIQSIQSDLANKSKRLSKSLKAEDLNALSSMIATLKEFASDVQSIQVKIEEVANKYLLQGVGPKKAVEDAKLRQKQKAKNKAKKAKQKAKTASGADQKPLSEKTEAAKTESAVTVKPETLKDEPKVAVESKSAATAEKKKLNN